MFSGGIRRSIPSCAQGFGGLSSPHSSTALAVGLHLGMFHSFLSSGRWLFVGQVTFFSGSFFYPGHHRCPLIKGEVRPGAHINCLIIQNYLDIVENTVLFGGELWVDGISLAVNNLVRLSSFWSTCVERKEEEPDFVFLELARITHWENDCLKINFLVRFTLKKDLTSEF